MPPQGSLVKELNEEYAYDKAMHITVVDHPLAASRLTLMRDERSDNATFRAALADLGTMLIYEASRHLDVEHFDTKTPVGIAQGTRGKDR